MEDLSIYTVDELRTFRAAAYQISTEHSGAVERIAAKTRLLEIDLELTNRRLDAIQKNMESLR